MLGALRGQKTTLDHLELELRIVVKHHESARNCKSKPVFFTAKPYFLRSHSQIFIYKQKFFSIYINSQLTYMTVVNE